VRDMSTRRILAVFRKEMREYGRTGSIVAAMAIMPLIFLVQPIVAVAVVPASQAGGLAHEHFLLYMLAVPALVPATLAAYAVVGERHQQTLEPVLSTPLRRREFLLGKALAALVPSVAVAYLVYAAFIVYTRLSRPDVASVILQAPDIIAQLVFTPLIAAWSIWIGIAISARSRDIRVAQQVTILVSLPAVAVTSLTAFNVIRPTHALAVGLAVALLLADSLGWRFLERLINRERLVTDS
jgi:ABC-type transport system involved in multi-copper enzyme maturation permease subunit